MHAVLIARVRYDFRGVPILVHSDKSLTLNWQLGPHHRPPHTLGVLSDVLYDVCAETDLIALCLTADRCILRASGLGLAVHVAPQTLDHFMQTLSLYRPEPAWGPCPPGLFRAWRLGLFRKAFIRCYYGLVPLSPCLRPRTAVRPAPSAFWLFDSAHNCFQGNRPTGCMTLSLALVLRGSPSASTSDGSLMPHALGLLFCDPFHPQCRHQLSAGFRHGAVCTLLLTNFLATCRRFFGGRYAVSSGSKPV